MSDILKKIVAVKREEIALASKMKSFQAVRADAESRVLTRDFVGAIQQKIANQEAAVIAEIKKAESLLGWKPVRTIENSVKSLIIWYKSHPQGWGK